MSELKDALGTAVKLGQQTATPNTSEKIHFAVVPNDCKLVSLEDYQFGQFPIRKRTRLNVFDTNSLVSYFMLFHDDNSRIFGDPVQKSVTAVLDYHMAGEGSARFLDHRVTLTCRLSEEWTTWSGSNSKAMEQSAFAVFIEDNVSDITSPSGAAMLEVSRSLRASMACDFSSDIKLSNGQVQFRYQENIQGRVGSGEIEVPDQFAISIPIFFGEPSRTVQARLRWRVNADKKLTFWYSLVKAKTMVDEAFATVLEAISKGTGESVLLGGLGG